jgi:hypothetical protein
MSTTSGPTAPFSSTGTETAAVWNGCVLAKLAVLPAGNETCGFVLDSVAVVA